MRTRYLIVVLRITTLDIIHALPAYFCRDLAYSPDGNILAIESRDLGLPPPLPS
jgi:hypothetical protein